MNKNNTIHTKTTLAQQRDERSKRDACDHDARSRSTLATGGGGDAHLIQARMAICRRRLARLLTLIVGAAAAARPPARSPTAAVNF